MTTTSINPSNIINLANANEREFKKRDVNTALLTVINAMPEDTDTETVQALATLYLKLFKKSKSNKKNKSPLEVCSHFVGKNDVRYYLNSIKVTDSSIVASNGHILAWYDAPTGLDDGFYDPKALIRTGELESYPSFDRIFEQKILMSKKTLDPEERKIFECEKPYEIVRLGEMWFKAEYIDLIASMLTEESYTVDIAEACVIIKQGDFNFVCMPMRI